MISFILNNQLVRTDRPSGYSLVDFIRNDMKLTGTRTGCREGDCGACLVLEGMLENGKTKYKSVLSCLTPLINADHKHIVTIEGLNHEELNQTQLQIAENHGTQCGFCTPGFILAFTGFALSDIEPTYENVISAISGNICRCTGYKSIERAAEKITSLLKNKDKADIPWLVSKNFVPEYFLSIPLRLSKIETGSHEIVNPLSMVAGGTDIMVQKEEYLAATETGSFFNQPELQEIGRAHV